MSKIKVGDTVIVDPEFANGGYEAEVTWVGETHFARIKVGKDEWDIMQSRLMPFQTPQEIFDCAKKMNGTKRLKFPWIQITKAIFEDKDDHALSILNFFVENESEDVSMLRMLLDSTQPVRDQENFIPVRTKLINIIEAKIGKIN